MKYKTIKRKNQPKPNYDMPIMRCVNCDAVATSEDIKFGCARCESYSHGGHYVPKNFVKIHPEGGWYKDE